MGQVMDVSAEILRLVEQVRALEDRVRELEETGVDNQLDDAIGFEVADDLDEDFDEDDSEYRACCGGNCHDLEYAVDLSMGFGPGEWVIGDGPR